MSVSVSQVVAWTLGRVVNAPALGEKCEQIRIHRAAVLAVAKSGDIAFFFSRAYESELITARPGILITGEDFVRPMEQAGLPLFKYSAVIACADPYMAMAIIMEKLAATTSTVAHLGSSNNTVIHPAAVVHKTVELGRGVEIGPNCVLGERVKIGAGTILYPGCYLGPEVEVGEGSVLFPGVVLYEWTKIGSRVRIHAGAVIGADGFGYATKRQPGTNIVTGHHKIYHLGRVVVGDDVEIGANTCIDRGTIGDTLIGGSVKIDNQVQIGHNVKIGRGCIVCGCAGIAGSARLGEFVYVGGLTGISNQVNIGDRANLGAASLISKDVVPGAVVVGNPQRPHKEHFKAHALLNRLMVDRKKGRQGVCGG